MEYKDEKIIALKKQMRNLNCRNIKEEGVYIKDNYLKFEPRVIVTVQIGLRVSQGTPSVHRADRKKTQRSRAYGPLHSVSSVPNRRHLAPGTA